MSTSGISAGDPRSQPADSDINAAIALWQFENDRLNGLATKAAALLAADAIVGAGIATQTDSRLVARCLLFASIVYLVSAAVAACLVQAPMERQVLGHSSVRDGSAAEEMVAVVVANEHVGVRLQNLVYVSFRDTFVSLVLFLVALVAKMVGY
ncbi:hypothetical protein GCM10022415_15750 [Knoellia locipacati]|uniref:Uncharacterized protein n=1 Tax=Knoellia locipacati TaxID=882824 RepID=A0A512SZX0_9MICO|nr:hypothetical protein KLO01_15720 [Knoellia locipacati]